MSAPAAASAADVLGACVMLVDEPGQPEICKPGFEMVVDWQCIVEVRPGEFGPGEQSPGWLYHPDIGTLTFDWWARTPQGLMLYHTGGRIFRSSFGDTCNRDGSVVED